MQKRATALAKTKLGHLNGTSNGSEPPAEESQKQPQGETVPTLPEAPASANCHITIEGRHVQVTLRDTDETKLLTRLAALLQQYPIVQPPTQAPSQGTAQPVPDESPYCRVHKVALQKSSKDGRTWYSHKAPDGSWCYGK